MHKTIDTSLQLNQFS